jgi:hypothetical protein
MEDRMRALLARERELVVRRHADHDATRFGVDLEELVEEETAGAVRAIGDERGIERHRRDDVRERALGKRA